MSGILELYRATRVHVFLACVSILLFFAQKVIFENVAFYNLLVYATCIYLISFVLYFVDRSKYKSLNIIFLAVLCLLTFIINSIVCYIFFNFGDSLLNERKLVFDDVRAIYQSNIDEIVEFLAVNFGLKLFFLFAASVFLIVIWKRLVCSDRSPIFYSSNFFLFGIFAFFLTLYGLPVSDIFTYSRGIYQAHEINNDKIKKLAKLFSNPEIDSRYNIDAKIHFLIIGESFNKDHSSAFGYFRDTTPWLKSARQNKNAMFFDNAYAPYCHTSPALNLSLTNFNQYRENPDKALDLVGFLTANNFDVHWISEQIFYEYDAVYQAIANKSSDVSKVDEGNFAATLRKINKIVEGAADNNKLIVVHLMGSHADYKQRVRGFDGTAFDSTVGSLGDFSADSNFVSNILNPYDKSIEYTDYKLAELFKVWEKLPNAGTFTFFSDHGEDVFGKKFHNASLFSFPMIRVPLVFILSDRFKLERKFDIEKLSKLPKQFVTLDLFFETYLDLLGFSNGYDVKFSVFDKQSSVPDLELVSMQRSSLLDENYFPVTQALKILDDPQVIGETNVAQLNKILPGKIVGNHADSLLKASIFRNLGFEKVEFNFAPHKGVVGHYPEYLTDLNLEEYLNHPVINQFDGFWIDMKLPGAKVSDASFLELQNSLRKFPATYFLLEAQSTDLRKINGFVKSFYVRVNDPVFKFEGCKLSERLSGSSLNIEDRIQNRKRCAADVARRIKSAGATQISFNITDYPTFIFREVMPLLDRKDYRFNVFGLPPELSVYNPELISVITSDKYKYLFDKSVNLILFN